MKILVTGAHFTPAQAVIEELKKNYQADIVYVGRRTTLEGDPTPSVESQVLPKLGVKFIPFTTGRLQREFSLQTIPSLLKIPIGFIQATFILLKEKPDVILSFGGYVAVPTVLMGWLFSIPIIIHEQGLISGLANKISSLFADKIALSFNNGKFADKTVLTGNPLRQEILDPIKKLPNEYIQMINYSNANKLPIILVLGGNQGSHAINLAVEESLSKLLQKFVIIHQTGESKFKDFDGLEKLQNEKYLVKKWIGQEIGGLLKKVDLVVCRGGINTLLELAYFNKPTLVIPIPNHFEQNKNARYFESLGLVKNIPQSKLSTKILLEEARQILKSHKRDADTKKVVILDAAKRLALETILLT